MLSHDGIHFLQFKLDSKSQSRHAKSNSSIQLLLLQLSKTSCFLHRALYISMNSNSIEKVICVMQCHGDNHMEIDTEETAFNGYFSAAA